MARAVRLARYGMFTTSPNPRVGCVIVNGSQVVGEGWHIKAGGDHAEIIALKQAGDRARGASCYVTLEPCIHTDKKTPPCTPALIQSGITKVIAAMIDPNPRVIGKGLDQLKQAGISAVTGLLQDEATALNPGFIKRMSTGLPYVRCKLAVSIDGKTALANGASKWITGEQARQDVQRLRAESCVILTGIGTVLTDDPLLTVRDFDTLSRQPVRAVIDRQLRIPSTKKIFEQGGPVVIFTENTDQDKHRQLTEKGATVVMIDSGDFLQSCLRYLVEKTEANEVLIEAGPKLSGSMIKAGLVDELIIYQAAVILGDKARAMLELPEISDLGDSIGMTLTDTRHIGHDLRLTWQFNRH